MITQNINRTKIIILFNCDSRPVTRIVVSRAEQACLKRPTPLDPMCSVRSYEIGNACIYAFIDLIRYTIESVTATGIERDAS